MVYTYNWDVPGGSVAKNPPANAGDTSLIPGLGKFPWRRKWQPTPVFLPGESHGTWHATVYEVVNSQTRTTTIVSNRTTTT